MIEKSVIMILAILAGLVVGHEAYRIVDGGFSHAAAVIGAR